MLIEFSVANFRSFRERQTLSMVAAPRLGRKENSFAPDLPGEKFPDLLKAVAIYGPNASGKSNLLRALGVVPAMATRVPVPFPAPLPVVPFGFDPKLSDEPSVFELHFVQSGLRYSYELAATSARVISERLAAYPGGKESLLYDRRYEKGREVYRFGEALSVEASAGVLDAWKQLTSPTVLFIAQAVANSSNEMQLLRRPFDWLASSSMILMNGMSSIAAEAQDLIHAGNTYVASEISAFLRDLDVPVTGVKVESVEDAPRGLMARISRPERSRYKTILTHRTTFGETDISFDDESEGTRNLFGFWLPWFAKSVPSVHAGYVLAVDEIDSSLHPKIVEALIARHLIEPRLTQLIFTTHDTHLMDSRLLRRDQIWLTERDANGATQLRSIHEFKGRQSEDIEKRYYEGRYRGLPLTIKSRA